MEYHSVDQLLQDLKTCNQHRKRKADEVECTVQKKQRQTGISPEAALANILRDATCELCPCPEWEHYPMTSLEKQQKMEFKLVCSKCRTSVICVFVAVPEAPHLMGQK